ncbi:hypothetical protein D931_00001, partial [Enterococcus faecium 13.SD.W.09]
MKFEFVIFEIRKNINQFGTHLAQEQTKTAKNKGSRRLNNVPG